MTTYYIDPANGNDANNGLSWGTPWKTMLNGASMATLSQTDSDTIRIAKSPDPVNIGSTTWTTNSDIITVSGLTNMLIEDCDSGWTNVAATSLTHSTAYVRSGTASVSAAISNTSGRIAYKNWGGSTVNLSAMARLCLWVNFGTAADYRSAANPFEIHLCSDTIGNSTVVKFTLPQTYYPANSWVPITINPDASYSFGSATAIASVAIRCGSSATNTIRIDNIFACKGATDATSLALTDLICKDNGKGEWFPVTYVIAGGQVGITSAINGNATVNRAINYYFCDGVNGTQTINSLKRECFNTGLNSATAATATSSAVNAINFATGSASNFSKTYIGGVNPATDIVDGETWFDGMNGYGYGLTQTNGFNSNWTMDRISAVRYYVGLIMQEGMNVSVTNCNLVGNRTSYEFRYNDRYTFSLMKYKNGPTIVSFPWIFSCQGSTGPTITQDSPGSVLTYRQNQVPQFTVTNAFDGGGNVIIGVGTRAKITSTGTLTSCTGTTTGSNTIVNLPARGHVYVNNIYASGPSASYFSRAVFGIPSTTAVRSSAPTIMIRFTGKIGMVAGTAGTGVSIRLLNPAAVPHNIVVEGYGANNQLNSAVSGVGLMGSITTSNYTIGNWTFRNINSQQAIGNVDYGDGSFLMGTGQIVIQNWNGDGITRLYTVEGYSGSSSASGQLWVTDASQKTAGATSWLCQMDQSSIATASFYSTSNRMLIGTIVFRANKQVTMTIQVRRADATNGIAFMECWFTHITQDDMYVSSVGSANTWETLTITFTPTENISGEVYIGTTQLNAYASQAASSVWFDNFTVTQAD